MQSTAHNAVEEQQTFRITHPFHPLACREYVLLSHKLNWGEDRVSFKDEDGLYHCIPANWTDVIPRDPFEFCGNNDSYFRIDDLIEVRDIVRKLKS